MSRTTHRHSVLSRALVVLVFVSSTACDDTSGPDDQPDRICAMAGCVDGISIDFAGQPETFTLIVRPTDGSEPRIIECSPQNPCDLILIPNFKPPEFVVEIRSEELEFTSSTLSPPFLPVPDPSCGPNCGLAAIGIDLRNLRQETL